ncbi:hypothetical protein HW452_05225 [Halomonas aquamarina]|uniref:Uncharacterized protein n=1 Tax=Vreelandella aquamarina TaxID=77097 RepID=A0ACC5VS06_9GAMM|nr:hypothetical protein [Halomonas aquamarina]MBZ5486923.1 hypothetical protein [Halomonas aquamarina]
MTTYNVVIAADQNEAEEYAAWLIEQGHTAVVGNTTRTTIDGQQNDVVSEQLWNDYCKGY